MDADVDMDMNVHVDMQIHVNGSMITSMSMYIRVCVELCMCIRMCVCIHMFMCMCVCMCTCTCRYMNMWVYVRTPPPNGTADGPFEPPKFLIGCILMEGVFPLKNDHDFKRIEKISTFSRVLMGGPYMGGMYT